MHPHNKPPTRRANTTLDDIAAVVGFSAAVRLAAFYGGKNVYVAAHAAPGQVLTDLIGLPCASAMAREWGGETLAVPGLTAVRLEQRAALVAKLHGEGLGLKTIGEAAGCTARRAGQVVTELTQQGVIRPPGREKATAARVAKREALVIRLHGDGHKLTAIAARAACTTSRVGQILRAAGACEKKSRSC